MPEKSVSQEEASGPSESIVFWDFPTLSLSANLSSSCALSFSQVAVTPAPLLATASNTTFSPAGEESCVTTRAERI